MVTTDSKQRIQSAFTLAFELYKSTTGCFLSYFAFPALSTSSTTLYGLHGVTFASMIGLYVTETLREDFCISHFDVDEDKTLDNLDEEIEAYPEIKKKLRQRTELYNKAILAAGALVTINAIATTGVYLATNNLEALKPSIAPFLSFTSLMAMKLWKARNVAKGSLENEVAQSAFLATPLVYNTIDRDKV